MVLIASKLPADVLVAGFSVKPPLENALANDVFCPLFMIEITLSFLA